MEDVVAHHLLALFFTVLANAGLGWFGIHMAFDPARYNSDDYDKTTIPIRSFLLGGTVLIQSTLTFAFLHDTTHIL